MKVRIHRGTREIGGTCIEVEDEGKRIVLDLGLPLDTDPVLVPVPGVPGLNEPDASLLAIVLSHPHLDHYGLVHKARLEVPALIGEAAWRILRAAAPFVRSGPPLGGRKVHFVSDRMPVRIGPFTVTPYLVDHSAYDAYAFCIEAGGKGVFYSGDFRAHGRKAALVDRLLNCPPKPIDLLLVEGTALGRGGGAFPTEEDLVPRFAKTFERTEGLALVWCSGQNIDRLNTVWKAARKARRGLIIDGYTAHVLAATGNRKCLQPDWPGASVFWPDNLRVHVARNNLFHLIDNPTWLRVYPERLAKLARRSAMLFRPSMLRDLEKADCLAGASVTYSMWRGYLDRDHKMTAAFKRWIGERKIPLHQIHTSGHADVPTLRRLIRALDAGTVVPIHSERPEKLKDLAKNVVLVNDGEWREVGGG
ncbi:MAG: MBL fold metallo-hydrolase [Deltaproteobacteria bacterium]|nr:MBL fold metallo-hydrolase [Deltaproteobacteria bacterium]